MGAGASHIAVQRQGKCTGSCFRAGKGNGKRGVGAQIFLILRTVQFNQKPVYLNLI